MESDKSIEDVPVRQDIMPPNPRATRQPSQPSQTEYVDHIPVREVDQPPAQTSNQAQSSQQNTPSNDGNLDLILKEVNQQVAATDMTAKKKKRFIFGKHSHKPARQQQTAHKPHKSTKIFVVDGIAVTVATSLIALAVKVYR